MFLPRNTISASSKTFFFSIHFRFVFVDLNLKHENITYTKIIIHNTWLYGVDVVVEFNRFDCLLKRSQIQIFLFLFIVTILSTCTVYKINIDK